MASLNGLTSYFFSFSSGIRLNCNQHIVCCKEVIFTEDDCLRLIFLLKSSHLTVLPAQFRKDELIKMLINSSEPHPVIAVSLAISLKSSSK